MPPLQGAGKRRKRAQPHPSISSLRESKNTLSRKRLRVSVLEKYWLTFGELRCSTGLLKTVFMTFFHARIAGQEAGTF